MAKVEVDGTANGISIVVGPNGSVQIDVEAGANVASILIDENATGVVVNNEGTVESIENNADGTEINNNGTIEELENTGEGVDYNGTLPDQTTGGPPNGFVLNENSQLLYSSIQDAIDAADAADVLIVAAGTYEEVLHIDRPIILNGPNNDIAGYDPSRVSEAIIQYPAALANGSYYLATIDAENVSIKGLTFNDNISGGFTYDGTWPIPMLVGGVVSNESNTSVENNRFSGFNNIAVRMTQQDAASTSTTGAKTNNTTRYNYFEGSTVYHAIYYQASGGTIEYNQLVDCGAGVQVQPYRTNATGIVSNNEMSIYTSGLYYNYANWTIDENALWSFTDNEVTAVSNAPEWDKLVWNALPRSFEGIRVETYLQNSAPPNFEPKANFAGNTINGANASSGLGWSAVYGIYFRNVKGDVATNVQRITISNNTFSNVEIGAQFDEATDVEYSLSELFGNGNIFPENMVIIEPYQIGYE